MDSRTYHLSWPGRCSRVLLLVAAAACLVATEARSQPTIEASINSLDFDSTAVGTTDTVFVAIRNVGTALLNLMDITAADPFGAFPDSSQSVPVGDSLVVGVTFTPFFVGGETGGLVVAHDDPVTANPLIIPIEGFGTDVELILGAPALDFGEVRIGFQKQLFVSFETLGTDTLRITGATLVDSAFSASPDSLVVTFSRQSRCHRRDFRARHAGRLHRHVVDRSQRFFLADTGARIRSGHAAPRTDGLAIGFGVRVARPPGR